LYCLAFSKWLGLVDAVVKSGVPIVMGHRWPLIDGASSTRFVQTFYQRLLSQYPPDQALLFARQAVAADDPTWASSVMVMQTAA
jgi:CHAT domain-containing protein